MQSITLIVALVVVVQAVAWDYSKTTGFSASSCESMTNQSKCGADSTCAWCTSAAVGDSCMDAKDAAGLPAAVFTCSTPKLIASSSCEDQTSENKCTSDSSCSWCTSAAVGDSCMSASDAKSLPAAVFTCSNPMLGKHHHSGGGSSGDASTLYVLAYSWSPGFCNTQSGDPGCSSPEPYWGTHFTLHGLWPQYATSGYPADCTNEAFDPNVPEAIGMDTMQKYWPNVQESEGSSDYDNFWEHEWTKHGTCSGLKQSEYFNTTIAVITSFGTPSVVTNNVGKSVSGDDIRSALGGSTKASLICSSGSQLTGAYTCWSQSNGVPQEQVTCPDDVQNEDTCSGSTVTIPSF